MSEARPGRRIVLHPGDVYFGSGPAVVETVLGSCLSIVLRNPLTGFAAMSHCMLPRGGAVEKATASNPETYKYVDTCITVMLDLLEPHGGLASVEVKIFGGADMFPPSAAKRSGAIGAENAAVAMDLLQARNMRILRSDLGGNQGRKVRFDTRTGEVLVRRLNAAQVVLE